MLLHRLFGGQGRRWSASRGLQRRSRRPALELLEQRELLTQVVTVGGTKYELTTHGGVNEVLKYNGSSWTSITGTNTTVSQISTIGNGLFMVANNGKGNQTWQYSGSGTNWILA